MINFGEFAAEVFQTLRAYGRELVLYDEDGNRVFEPKEARRFYISDDNILVSLSEDGDNSALKLYLSPSIELAQVSGFINTLRAMATRANLLFHVKKYDKEIKPQHFATSASLNEQEQPQMNIMEGMYGTSKSSYLKLESARMIVRHTASVNENMIGSRGRNIKAIFVENAQGERFRFPVNLLSGARAMTQHVNQGGTFADEVGQQIIRMAQDFRNLAQTAAHVRDNAKALPQQASSIRESVMQAMKSQKLSFARIYETRSYSRECARIVEAAQLNEAGEQIQEKLEALKGIFGESLDESVLTTVARLVNLPEAAPVTEDVNIEDHGQNSTAFKVMLNGEEIDTVFFGGGYTPEEVKASLVNHDGYDPAIEVLPEGASCMEDEGGEDEGYGDSEGGDTDITDEGMMSVNDEDAYAAPKNPIIKQFEAWMNEFDPEQMLEGKSFKRGRDDDDDEDDDVDFKKKQEKKKRDERQSKKQPVDEGKTFKHDDDEDEGDSKQKRKEHKKQRDERRGKDEDLHEDVKASDDIANEIERLDLNVAPESRQAFDIFLNHNLSKVDPNNDLTIADAVKLMPVADAQKLLRDMKARFKFEDSEMTEARVKSPDAESEVSMHDIKSEIYALKDKLSKTGVFDPEYRSLRARIDQLSHELKKVMPYGKAMQKGDMVEAAPLDIYTQIEELADKYDIDLERIEQKKKSVAFQVEEWETEGNPKFHEFMKELEALGSVEQFRLGWYKVRPQVVAEDDSGDDEEFDSNSDLEEDIKKGAFHRWLGKSEDSPITAADIQKGLNSRDPHARKMAQFAKNMQHIHEFAEDPASKMQPGWYVKKNGMIGSGPFHSEEEAKNNSGDAPVAYWSGHDWMTNEDESMVPQDQSQDFEDDVTTDDPELVPGMTEAVRLAQLAGIKK